MLKIAVFAPMPSASVITAMIVNPGCFSNIRAANLTSWSSVPISDLLRTQCDDRVDPASAARRQPTGDEGDGREQHRY